MRDRVIRLQGDRLASMRDGSFGIARVKECGRQVPVHLPAAGGDFHGAPKRGQLQVVAQLGREFPELKGLEPEMRRQLLDLRQTLQQGGTQRAADEMAGLFRKNGASSR